MRCLCKHLQGGPGYAIIHFYNESIYKNNGQTYYILPEGAKMNNRKMAEADLTCDFTHLSSHKKKLP